MTLNLFQTAADSAADPAAVVLGPEVRFTVLTSRLLRLEHDPAGRFEDRPSQAFWHRRQPVPLFEVRRACPRSNAEGAAGQIEIETEHLRLRYRPRAAVRGFTPRTLSVHVRETDRTWRHGDPPSRAENLRGTARTLDETSGHVRLEPGLMARGGWAVVDDSAALVFEPDGWLAPRAGAADLYFFGYGRDYRACLRDFCRLAGRAPLLPRWALGNWWSRYWEYSAAELLALMDAFRASQVPLSVCIVDMDWHLTRTGNDSSGWTGYTWNPELFPDPAGFLAGLHALGLKTALNLHPAEGVHPHETAYPEMAAALGIDPALEAPIPFDIADPAFTQAYFEILHHPLEAQGVDFWWMDWQQGQATRLPGLDPLWWLNHLHFHDLGRDGRRRPFIFSRWGGLGNHRYPIGFSGDTNVSWESLALQPGFTAAAANVGYGWWSHDIGGHMGGVEDDELYLRWVQFGAFSPILRLHSTKNSYHERRPWARGPAAAQLAAEAMRLRHALIPYLYSMAWRDHVHSLPLVQPMYYTHPEAEAAYACPQQYWFGSELVAAPFTAPMDPDLGLSRQSVWLPPGEWFDFFDGAPAAGGGWRAAYGGLARTPVFARAGALVPLAPRVGWGGLDNPRALEVHAFPGADNRFELYEDDGETTSYQRGQCAWTAFTQAWTEAELRLGVLPARGDAGVVPAQREVTFVVHDLARPGEVQARRNGLPLACAWEYDPERARLQLGPVALAAADELSLVIGGRAGAPLRAGRDLRAETARRLLRAFRLDTWLKQRIDQDLPDLLSARGGVRRYAGLKEAQVAALESALAGEAV